jgi:hypothetical protein
MEAMNEMVAVRRTPTARWRPRRASGVRESPAAGSTYARELTLNCGKRSRRRRVELMDRDDVAYEGQREYTPAFLRIYDLLILGFFAPVVWRCPTTRLVEGYRRHVGHRHLDVGPGTGYFLARAGMPDGSPVTLLDPTCTSSVTHRGGCSAWTSRPLRPTRASHCPSTGRSTRPRSTACFIACQDRSRARLLPSPTWPTSLLRQGSSSVHRSSVTPGDTRLSRSVLKANNRRGTFDNHGDTQDGLREILEASF